jgi:hypothetical protein
VREDFGAAAMLIGSLVLALVVALLARTRPPFGSVALGDDDLDGLRREPVRRVALRARRRDRRPGRRPAAAVPAARNAGWPRPVPGAVGSSPRWPGRSRRRPGSAGRRRSSSASGVAAGLCGFAIGALIERHSFAAHARRHA